MGRRVMSSYIVMTTDKPSRMVNPSFSIACEIEACGFLIVNEHAINRSNHGYSSKNSPVNASERLTDGVVLSIKQI